MNNEKKLSYETPSMEITAFESEDVIRTSGFPGPLDPANAGDEQE